MFQKNKLSLPDFSYENNLLKQGFKVIAGLDEAGRGSWAGPIVAGAVIISPKSRHVKCRPATILPSTKLFNRVKDSKKLSAKQRERLFKIITTENEWAVGVVNEKIIDKIGIGKANILAIKKAFENLAVKPDFLLIDGSLKIDKISIPFYNVIKGDKKIFSCSCASIVAKVWRDRLMADCFHKKYPKYGFNKHKGYGTKHHLTMIKKHGICPLHRKSFKPIKND